MRQSRFLLYNNTKMPIILYWQTILLQYSCYIKNIKKTFKILQYNHFAVTLQID